MEYVGRYSKEDKILEIGAVTGRYSIAPARAGLNVTAVEFVGHNLEILRKNGSHLAV